MPDWRGYKVSSRGRAKSMPRVLANGQHHGGGFLTPVADEDGYLYVHLRDGERERRVAVHTLVLEAFVGPRPDGMEARHLDDDPARNWLEELSWGTHEDNEQDKRRNRTRKEEWNRTVVSSPFPAVTPVTAELR